MLGSLCPLVRPQGILGGIRSQGILGVPGFYTLQRPPLAPGENAPSNHFLSGPRGFWESRGRGGLGIAYQCVSPPART